MEAAERRESTDKHQKPNRKHYLLVIQWNSLLYTKSNFDYIDIEFRARRFIFHRQRHAYLVGKHLYFNFERMHYRRRAE